MARRRRIPPFEIEIDRLGKGGVGVGTAPDGAPMRVRFAPPGSRLYVVPAGKRKGVWAGRRMHMIRPPAAGVVPRCAAFGVCGGCQLQELGIDAQRSHRHRLALRDIAAAMGAPLPPETVIHPPRATSSTYGYRNKVELTFGSARFTSEAEHRAGAAIDGRFLGFHAAGRFDRVVDVSRCEIASEPINAVIATTRALLLGADGPAPYAPRDHAGFLRHLLVRHGAATGDVLAVLFTSTPSTPTEEAAAVAWGEAVARLSIPDGRVVGAAWAVGDQVADVARGDVRRQWGEARFRDRLGDVTFSLSATSFFQTNTAGAEVLYDTVGEALSDAGGTLYDLYCGTGAIGLYLAARFDRVVGIEERPEAVADAVANARASGIPGTFTAARVEDVLTDGVVDGSAVVVDPPRVGLHPRVARTLARCAASHLVYVACKPGSLGRDAAILTEGGWRLDALWTVDLFPHTGHVEAVARFVR